MQYRAVEFALGNKNEKMLSVIDHPANLALLTAEWEKPTLYDEFLRFAARRGAADPELDPPARCARALPGDP